MTESRNKRLELRYVFDDDTVLDLVRVVPGYLIDLAFADILEHEKDLMRREFGLALVDKLGLEVEETDE